MTRLTLATLPGFDTAMRTLARRPIRRTYLADPPAGSGLRPVPGDRGLPVVGAALDALHDVQAMGLARERTYGPVSWCRFFGVRGVIVSGGKGVQHVLTNPDKVFANAGWEFFIDRFFHRGLMLLDGTEHHSQRRVMQLAFTRPRLAGYVDRMDPIATTAVNVLPSTEVRLFDGVKQLSLDIATVLFMAGERGEAQGLQQAFEACVHAGTALVRRPVPGLSWSRGLAGRRVLEQHFRAGLTAKRTSDGDDLFAALCHARTADGERLSDDDVVNQMIFLMMAAHDTSTITASAAAYYLARHPEWQQRVVEEAAEAGDGPLTLSSLDGMTSLDLVLNEAMRLTSAVPALVRRAVADTEILGYHVPRGCYVVVVPGVDHRLERYWTDPDRFDPERFAEHRREDKAHRFAYLPFGGGAHKCIGMHFGRLEVKIILHRLLRRFQLHLRPDYELTWDKSSLWFPPDGLPVRLRPR